MKHRLLTLVLMLAGVCSAWALTTTSIILRHQGTSTMYDNSQIETALNDAVEGDTILLGRGYFTKFNIYKSGITLRGEGNSTLINGTMYVSGSNLTLEGFHVGESPNSYSNLYFEGACNNLRISQVSCNQMGFSWSVGENIVMDRLYVNYEFYSNAEMRGTVTNCDFNRFCFNSGTADDLVFVNCRLRSVDYIEKFRGTYLNSIVYSNPKYYYSDCTFSNTVLLDGQIKNDCEFVDSWQVEGSDMLSWDEQQLRESGYLGNDGTVVGHMGGANPYSLELGVPRVASSKVLLDNETGVLDVTVTFAE